MEAVCLWQPAEQAATEPQCLLLWIPDAALHVSAQGEAARVKNACTSAPLCAHGPSALKLPLQFVERVNSVDSDRAPSEAVCTLTL